MDEKRTDYRIWTIHFPDDVHIGECLVAFYECEKALVDEWYLDESEPKVRKVEKYQAKTVIDKMEVPSRQDKEVRYDTAGVPHVVYTEEDFGKITKVKELIAFLDKELGKDPTRVPVDKVSKTHL